jgi:peroxiredoxin
MHRQPPVVAAAGSQYSCPRCGASIDIEMGRCTGCGLLYKGKPRIVQQAASATQPPRPSVASSPQYRGPAYSSPPSGSGQRPSYVSPGAVPYGGMQAPIPRVAPAAASTAPMQAGPYPYETVPPVPRGRGVSGAGKGGLIRGITIMFIVVVCLIVGGGIYYFINQTETPAPSNETVDIMPPSIQGISTPSITETGATISWGTDEPTRGKVEYWKTETDVLTRLDENLSTSHSIPLTELDINTTYYFKITSTDAAGNQATAEGSLKTLAAADETAPTISAVSSSSITESSAIITWITDEPATSQVEYGETEEYGSTTTENTALSTTHNVTLTGLDDSTTYYFKVISKDASGNEATLADNQQFTTESIVPVGYEVGDRAPDFTLKDINDVEWTLSEYKGKIVIVNFWATLCGPCLGELPYFQEIQASEDWSGNVWIFAINCEETAPEVRSFLQDHPEYQFTVLLDSDGVVVEEYGFTEIPRTFFIDAEGIIKEIKEEGPFLNAGEIEDILESIQTE